MRRISEDINICPSCGKTKWKTLVKRNKWKCRTCGYVTGQIVKPIALVSVIIPTHKGRDLSQVLEAIDKSTYRNVEVIIVSEGKERSAQRNIGIDRSTGDYLLFLDSDMVITPTLIGNCVNDIGDLHALYIPEIITTKGLFARIRNWERQFYTGTAVDCVRFIKKKFCPYFDPALNGPEDSHWDRLIQDKRVLSYTDYYEHYEDINFIGYFKKKAYYAKSMKLFAEMNKGAKILNWKWRCFGVFLENGKWKKFLRNPLMATAVLTTIFIRGIIYLWKKR